MDKNYLETIYCSKETKKLLMDAFSKLFLIRNPEFQGMNLTQGFLSRKAIERAIESYTEEIKRNSEENDNYGW